MRISDWSSDVCSSDLDAPQHGLCEPDELQPSADHLRGLQRAVAFFHQLLPAVQELQAARVSLDPRSGKGLTHIKPAAITRSEERRVGKACVLTCRSRWAPEH